MSSKPEKPYWTSTEASVWRSFLNTGTGKKLLRFLAEAEPVLLRKGEVNEIMIRSGEVAHHKSIISDLLYLTGATDEDVVEDGVSESYPPLDADDHWQGEKLNQPTPEE